MLASGSVGAAQRVAVGEVATAETSEPVPKTTLRRCGAINLGTPLNAAAGRRGQSSAAATAAGSHLHLQQHHRPGRRRAQTPRLPSSGNRPAVPPSPGWCTCGSCCRQQHHRACHYELVVAGDCAPALAGKHICQGSVRHSECSLPAISGSASLETRSSPANLIL